MLGVSFPLILFLLMKIPYISGHRSDLMLLSTASLGEKKKKPAAMPSKEKLHSTKENLTLECCL